MEQVARAACSLKTAHGAPSAAGQVPLSGGSTGADDKTASTWSSLTKQRAG
jgi:hypothetical protein